jgi:hypothetical protein
MKQQLAYSNILLSIVYHLEVLNKNMSSLSGDWNLFVLVHNVVQMYIKLQVMKLSSVNAVDIWRDSYQK